MPLELPIIPRTRALYGWPRYAEYPDNVDRPKLEVLAEARMLDKDYGFYCAPNRRVDTLLTGQISRLLVQSFQSNTAV